MYKARFKIQYWRKSVSSLLALVFALTAVFPASAQNLVDMPAPGAMVTLSQAFNPPALKGIKVYPDNPFRLDFILDKGNSLDSNDLLKSESTRLIKYFLASLTVPEKDLWVNLSPYEKDRIVPEAFGLTEMGRDLLEQDYLLKQITASIIYPENEIGKKFWKQVYEKAYARFGTTDIPVDTFNKVWVMPEKATVYENAKAGTAFVVQCRLKVMLESDYLALEKNAVPVNANPADSGNVTTQELAKNVIREVVIPELEREVNEGKNFARLRQVYQSLILATWFKKKITGSLLSTVYVDRRKVAGVNVDNPEIAQEIWGQYVTAFKKGVYNYIKEEEDPLTEEVIPRKYFSGGVLMQFGAGAENAMAIVVDRTAVVDLSSDNLLVVASQLNSPAGTQLVIPPKREIGRLSPRNEALGLKRNVVADLAVEDGFAENPKSRGNEKLHQRHVEYLQKYNAENNLIDGADPQFSGAYGAVKEILDSLLKTAGLDPSLNRLYLSDETAPNAFYLRGSNVFIVTLGLLRLGSKNGEIAFSRDAVAFVLAHEIQHLLQYRMDVLKGKVDQDMELNVDWHFMTKERMQQYLDEYDADWHGLDLMSKAGFTVTEASKFFRTLLEMIRLAGEGGKSVYLPFGDHPQLEPRTNELERLALGRYWPNQSKAATPFTGNVTLASSHFRDFQNRVHNMNSDEEFASLIMEAADIRELAIAISIGKARRNTPDYRYKFDAGDPRSSAIYALMNLLPALQELGGQARKPSADEKNIHDQVSEALAKLPGIPDELLVAFKSGVNTDEFTFNRISGISSTTSAGKKYYTDGARAGSLVQLNDGNIVIVTTGVATPDDTVEVVSLTGRERSFINPRTLMGAQTIRVTKRRDSLSAPQAPLQAISERFAQLVAGTPKARMQLRFYEEMFKKYLYKSDIFSSRRIEITSERDFFDPTQRREVQKAWADPLEFDAFVREATTQELIDSLDNLMPIWIALDGYTSGYSAYSNFRETLEGSSYGNPAYPRGDFIELIDAIIREVEKRIGQGTDGVDIIPRLVSALGTKNFRFAGEMYRSIGVAKLRLFLMYITPFLNHQRDLNRDSTGALTEVLDNLNFLSDSQSYFGEKNDEAKRMQEQISQLLYDLFKRPDTRDLVVALFNKHVKVTSPIKEKFFQLLRNDTTIGLNEKLFIVNELGRERGGFSTLAEALMQAPAGEGKAFVDSIMKEIIGKQPSLSSLSKGSDKLQRMAVLIYLGAYSINAHLIFQAYDSQSRTVLLDADELHLLRDFIQSDLPFEKGFWNLSGLVQMDRGKQFALVLSLLEFMKRNGQEGRIFRFLLNLDSRAAVGDFNDYMRYMYGSPGSLTLTADGLQYEKDMRSFSMFLGELIDRGADNDKDDLFRRIRRLPTHANEEGYSVSDMKDRLSGARPQRFGRWDLMQDGDKDHRDYFSFLDQIYSGKSFEEAVSDIARSIPESRLRDMLIHVLFVQKVLEEKLGLKVGSDKLFDYNWLREQVRAQGVSIHAELQAALALMGWDRDIQKLNAKYLAEVNGTALPVEAAAYEREKASYADARFYDIGGVDSQLALALASLDEDYLKGFLSPDRSLEEKLTMLVRYYGSESSYRDKYVQQILEQTLDALEKKTLDLSPDLEAQIQKSLQAFQNTAMRERYAMRFLEHSLMRIEAQKGSLSREDELGAILKYFPDFSYVRDEVLNQFVNRQVRTTAQYRAVAPLFVQNPENIRDTQSAGHMFWKDQLRDVLMNFSASAKTKFLLWLMGVGEKPEEVVTEEYRLHISFEGLRESMSLFKGKYYSGIGKRDQRDFFDSLFLGDKGIFANQSSYNELLSYIILSLFKVESQAMRDIFRSALNAKDISRRQKILYSLLQNYTQLMSSGTREERFAKSVRIFLEANGLIGIKLGQFLAHSALVETGSLLQKELLELNNASEPIDKGILFDMLEKIHNGRAFEDRYESLDEVKGVGGVAQVNKVQRKDGAKRALKFKKPEVDKIIARELQFLEEEILRPNAQALEAEGIPIPAGLLSRLKEMFEEELNFGDMEEEGEGEANNQRELKQNIERRKVSVVDGITYEFVVPTSDMVHENALMDQEFGEGTPLKDEETLKAQGINPEVIKQILMKELIQEFVVDGFFHADLHSGNVLISKMDGKVYITIIDVGAASRISATNREILGAILMALWDRQNWESNQEVVYRLFPQLRDGAEGEKELRDIVQSDRNPVQKLMYLFVLLEKKNIQFTDEYKEFYSVFRFLKASEYLFSDVLLEKMLGVLPVANVDEVKGKTAAIAEEIKRELATVSAPAVTTRLETGMRISLSPNSMLQAADALKRLKDLPFWNTVSVAFPQIDQLVNLLLGTIGVLSSQNKIFELTVPREKMPVYEDIKSDVMVLVGLIQRGTISPMALMSALAAVKRIAAKRDVIIDFLLSQHLPVNEIIDVVRQTINAGAADRLREILQPRIEQMERLAAAKTAGGSETTALVPDGERAQKGGIDLNPSRFDLQIQNNGGGINYNFDPVMIQKLQDMPGFAPVIIDIQPLSNVQNFLGIQDHPDKVAVVR